MADAIIAVGGTGKRAALLYLKLLNVLGSFGAEGAARRVFVIDLESQPDTLDRDLDLALQAEGVPATNWISPVPQAARINATITLAQFMNFGQGASPVAQTCFTSEQRNVQIRRGMNCEPTVGACVASRRFGEPDNEIVNLQGALASYDRFVIVGSLIGGTGAGVTGELARWLRENFPMKLVYGVLFLKWIDIPQGGIDEPNNTKILGNSRAWMNYLMENNPGNPFGSGSELFFHYVLIGAPTGMVPAPAAESRHHPLHLLGAIYILKLHDLIQIAPGATGPHYIELGEPMTAHTVGVGNENIEVAIVREKLLIRLLQVMLTQQPDAALSSFALLGNTGLSWPQFTLTLEKLAGRWNGRRNLPRDWSRIQDIFRRERLFAENRVDEFRDLTENLPGADEIFEFDWNAIERKAEALFPDALRRSVRGLDAESEVYDTHEQAIEGIARGFVRQAREITRSINIA
jgi:hypothetical protein